MKKWLITIIVLVLIISISFQIFATPSYNAESLINAYVECMGNSDFNKIKGLFCTKDLGFSINSNIMSDSSDFDILKSQKDYVVSLFGEKVWESINFSIKKIECPEKEQVFIERVTGNILTKNQAKKLNSDYWKEIAKKNNITVEELLLGNVNRGDKNKIMSFSEAKILGYEEPVIVQLVDAYDFYQVTLVFNGQEIASTGEYDFKILISNKYNKYQIYQGLTWSIPLEDNISDV